MRSKQRRQTALLAFVLLLSSILVYGAHYAIFRNAHDILYYLLMDVAFLFVQVLLVTVVIERLLSVRERQTLRKKTNVMLGVFFSQVGTPLIRLLGSFDSMAEGLACQLQVRLNASEMEFAAMRSAIAMHDSRLDVERGDLGALHVQLVAERDFLLRLLENPSLLEHDSFTELLWSVFHLAEELAHRQDLSHVPDSDRKHLEGDIHRAYHLLLHEWIDYMAHLQTDYPYLFSLAVRTNPFNPAADVHLHVQVAAPLANPN
jgi:hypothetical protein